MAHREPSESGARALAVAVPAMPAVERVRRIAELMRKGAWKASMLEPLAEQWGVSPITLRDSAAEASRQVRTAFDQDEARREIDRCLKRARACIRGVSDPTKRAELWHDHVELVGKMSGAAAAKRVHLTADRVPFGFKDDDEKDREP